MTEAQISDAIRLALGADPTLVLWRNNVGIAEHWNGKSVDTVRYGLAPGSADFIGVLKPEGRFVALEIKSPTGRATPDQVTWLALVRRMGGFAAIVRSVDEARAAIERARGGASE
jgi:hypothetical protein